MTTPQKEGEVERLQQTGTTASLFVFVWAFIAVGLSIGAWSVSTPLGASSDEPSHMIQAGAVVRGQLDGRQVELRYGGIPVGRIGTVEVPQWLKNMGSVIACFEGMPDVPAGCELSVGSDSRTVPAETQFSNYPPLYYSIVGVPTLLSAGSGALYGMRLVGVVLDSAFIALGLFLLAHFHPRRLTLLGALVALSPMVLFVSAVVNSSGLEVAAGFAAWCGGLCIVERTDIPRPLAILTVLSFVALILSRPLSPLYAGVIIVVLATLSGWTRSRVLIRQRSVGAVWISVLVATTAAGMWLVVSGLPSLFGVPEKPRLSVAGAVWLTLRLTGSRLRQGVGDFGWLDTPVPTIVVVVWALALVGLLVYGLAVSDRCRRALPLLALAILALPVIFETPELNTVGPYWQGRYWLPLALGLPLVASSVRLGKTHQVAPGRWARPASLRLTGFLGVGLLLVGGQVVAFLAALHRYETGIGAAPGSPVEWSPPGGTVIVTSLFVMGQLLLLALLAWQYHDTKGRSLLPHDGEAARARSASPHLRST